MSRIDAPAHLPSPPQETESNPSTLRRLWGNGLLAVAACLPWLVLHAGRLWSLPHYQFAVLIPLGALALGWSAWEEMEPLEPGSPRPASFLFALAWLLLFVAGLFFSPLAGTVGTLVVLVAVIWAVGGAVLTRELLPAWLFLWLIIPLPLNLDAKLVSTMQTATAKLTSSMLDLLEIPHVLAGHVVEVPGKRLLIEQACSGVHSLFSVLTCTFFFLLWMRCRLLRSVLLLVAAVFWVLLANVVRVSVIVWAFSSFGIDLSVGWKHDAIGWSLFGLTLGLLWSTDRFLEFIALAPLADDTDNFDSDTGVEEPAPPSNFQAGVIGSRLIAVAFGGLALVQIPLFWAVLGANSRVSGEIAKAIEALGPTALPAETEGWQRLRFDGQPNKAVADMAGVQSRSWTYRKGPVTATFSIDFPFPADSWHELTICYLSQGWALQQRRLPHAAEEATTPPCVEAHLAKPLDLQGYLWHGQMDNRGQWLCPPGTFGSSSRELAYRTLWRRLTSQASGAGTHSGVSYQVQLFVESYVPLSAVEQERARMLFEQLREVLREKLLRGA